MPSKYKRMHSDISEFDDLKNPLIQTGFVIPVTRAGASGKYYKPDSDGIKMPKYIDLEREEYTKVYRQLDHKRLVCSLSDRAKSLYLWLLFEVDMGKDYLWLNHQRYMDENDITSLTTYKAALKELLMGNILCKSHKRTIYWINPRAFFCGSRTNKYPDNVKVIQEINQRAEEPKIISLKRAM